MNWQDVLKGLESGELRSASPDSSGHWHANRDVKEGILAAFKAGKNIVHRDGIDKDNLLPRQFSVEDGVRVVPNGVRRGSYVSPGVIIMPPSYINVGAYVGEGTMVDSNCLVGSCAQIGKRVHLSAGVQIGGVLEPIGQTPVIIEDDAFIGAGALIVEGIHVGKRAVIAPGVVLSAGIPIYDLVGERILPKGAKIPENAVVVPGSRPILNRGEFAKEKELSLQCPVIIKYRDEKSDASLALEDSLR